MPRNPYELFLTRFPDFTEIQKAALKVIEEGNNCIITAPTGSGKTEAALLPVINRLTKEDAKGIFAIYITPLRALNRDLVKRLKWFGSELNIDIQVRHGDTSQSERRAQSLRPPQILITTPESVQNLLLSGRLKSALGNLKVVIVDEVHELYYNKRGAQLSIALERVEEVSKGFQRIGISATIGNVEEASKFLFGVRQHKTIESVQKKAFEFSIEMPVKPEKDNKEFRTLFGLDLQAYARIVRVADLIRESNATLVFSNARQAVESLGSKLIQLNKEEKFGAVGIHHSSIDRSERINVENDFKEGRLKALIATSSLELGIDVGRIDLVVQYGSPRQAIRLVQRVGRGGHRESEKSKGTIIVHNVLDGLESLAIVQNAVDAKLEKQTIEYGALDVLANQISAISLEYGKIEKKKILEIVKRAYPYKDLKESEFERVLSLLTDLRIVALDKETIVRQGKGRKYFIKAISVIPDSTRFVVKAAAENRIISTLDEEFVYNYVEEGAIFITKGLPWKVLSIEEDVIYVEQDSDLNAAIPDWDGEDIPVSRGIASDVIKMFDSGLGTEKYVDQKTKLGFLDFIALQKQFFTPKVDSILIEEMDNCAIAYLPLGKLANEYIARTCTVLASSMAGSRINVKATPYVLIFDYSYVIRRPETFKIFESLKGIDFNNLKFISSSELFRYKFVQIAKLFGVVEKDAKITKNMANRIISFYESSPIYDEVVRDLYKNYFDIETARNFVESLKSGKIKPIVSAKSGSPLSKEILNNIYKYAELLSTPERTSVIEKLMEKFDGRSIKVLCTYCGHVFNEKITLGKERKIFCTSCKSPLTVTYSDEYNAIVRKRLSGKHFTSTENTLYKNMMKEASLVDAYGDRALVALSTYGIGVDTAARLLKYVRGDYKMFFVDVIDAQKNFIKNRKFWKLD